MSYELHQDKHQHSGAAAATLIIPRTPITLAGTNTLLAIPVGSANVRPDGVTGAATHAAGEQVVAYFSQNVVKARAFASLGCGGDAIVASVNGAVNVGGITASAHWIVGQTLTAAAAGEVVSIFVNPRKA